jgi:hypothetical protein
MQTSFTNQNTEIFNLLINTITLWKYVAAEQSKRGKFLNRFFLEMDYSEINK